jgi:hypothetical protein
MASSPASTANSPDVKTAVLPKRVKEAKEDDEHIVLHNNMPLVFFALMLTSFLVCTFFRATFSQVPDHGGKAALDQTMYVQKAAVFGES